MNKYAIIVAGGKGLRLGGEIPKQFLNIGGLPVLMHTLQAFYEFDNSINLILVLPESHIDYWKQLCTDYKFEINHKIVQGGSERFYSVKNGLEAIDNDNSIVAVHDGVRPYVSEQTLQRCFSGAEELGNAVPVIDSVNSVRLQENNSNRALDRASIKLVQTPQTFRTDLLKEAYNKEFTSFFTDDASVFEHYGEQIFLVEGNQENIKITTSIDLIIANSMYKSKNNKSE